MPAQFKSIWFFRFVLAVGQFRRSPLSALPLALLPGRRQ
uniref:Uncharacterized protein n=1 Tax=Anguilla anguilla TaxID=7936 RepID=A0A0E9SUK2_ANGAN